MKKLLICIFLSCLAYSSLYGAKSQILIDSVSVKDGAVSLDFHAEGIVDDKIAEGLRKGRTSTFEYRIQLWGKKSGVLNQLIEEYYFPMKVYYDFWENKYAILTPTEKRLTPSLETVKEKCTDISEFEGIPIRSFRADMKYTFVVELMLRPLSVENYQEIKTWLGGEVKNLDLKDLKQANKQAKGFGTRILRMFMTITGFGDRVISTKSKEFKIQDEKIIW
jgi:hypothetical protein